MGATASPTGSQLPLCYRKLDPITGKVLIVNLQPDDPIQAWRRRSVDLAVWTEGALVNRTDSYGRYTSFESRAAKRGRTHNYTCKYKPYRSVIEAHYRGYHEEEVIGLHSTVVDSVGQCWCRWGVLDIDRHEASDNPSLNWSYAQHLYEKLVELGFHPILEDSNGRGGFHLWVLFDSPVESEQVFDFLTWLNQDWKDFGKGPAPEMFPKQRTLETEYGNWVRVPGRHHTRFHWSMLWDGAGWLAGDQAIDFLIGSPKASASRIPTESAAAKVRRPKGKLQTRSAENLVRAKDALGYINNLAFEYDSWLKVGMSLAELGDPGLELWKSWSAQVPEKFSATTCDQKWVGFTSGDPKDLSLGTLFLLAKEAGWQRSSDRRHLQNGPRQEVPATSASDGELEDTDLANSRRLPALFGGKILFNLDRGGWDGFDGRVWIPKADHLAEDRAKGLGGAIRAEMPPTSNPEVIQAYRKAARRAESKPAITSAIWMGKSIPELLTRDKVFDTNPWLFNCQNGTIDLRTGRFYPHAAGDLITKLAPVVYDPGAACPRFDRFLPEIFPGRPDVVEFMDLFMGYCLTGCISEQYFPINFGGGSNGKDLFIEIALYVMGDYAAMADQDLLRASRESKHPVGIHALRGRRLTFISESDQDIKINESLLKRLTGTKDIASRGMGENFSTFTRETKLFLAANHLPKFSGRDQGLWRRILRIDWPVEFVDQATSAKPLGEFCRLKDKGLAETLRAEAPGILARWVRACLRWQYQGGLNPPDSILQSTGEYRAALDLVGRFVEERCDLGAGFREQGSLLYANFEAWFEAENGGDRLPSKTAFGLELGRLGFSGIKDGYIYRNGLKIKEPAPASPPAPSEPDQPPERFPYRDS